MIIKILKIGIFLIAVYLFQSSFLPGIFYPINQLNIYLPILIFLLILYNEKVTLIYAVVFTIFQAYTSSLPILLFLFVLPFSVLILIKFYNRFFTNKSLYSILFLNGILLFLYNLFYSIFFLIYHFYIYKTISSAINYNILLNTLIWQLVLSSLIVFLTFIIINFLSKRLKTVFIEAASS